MQNKLNNKIIAALVISGTFLVPTDIMAKVSGACGSCHTMHNSQENVTMTGLLFGDGGGAGTIGDAANGSLLRYGCIGCHTGTNDGTLNIPFVLDTSAPDYATQTLAGGNFWWVAGDENTGHNVVGISAASSLANAPGGTMTDQVTCAGTMGCHGNSATSGIGDQFGSIAGGHHGDGGSALTADSSKTYVEGVTDDMSNAFRMLSGIKGIEDNDWEYTNTSADDHNLYYGVARTGDDEAAAGSISSLCANCHGDFHSGAVGGGDISKDGSFSSPWVRHPTDFDMGDLAVGSEYSGYTSYSTEAPVASNNITGIDSVIDDTLAKGGLGTGTGDAIVTCISCHRAHGSPNADLLRWTYGTENAHGDGDVNTGCYTCHTTKDN